MSDTQASKDKLLSDFNAVVQDTEQLLKSVAATGSEKTQALRASVEHNLAVAKERLRDYQDAAVERARAAGKAADEYVHSNPWQSIAAGVALGAIIGVVMGLLLNRR